MFIFQLPYLLMYANKTIFAKIVQSLNIAILTLNLFCCNFSTICVRDDPAFCSLIMFMIEVNFADKNIRNMSANHALFKKIHANENIFAGIVQTSYSQFDLDLEYLCNVIRKQILLKQKIPLFICSGRVRNVLFEIGKK